MLPEHLDVFEKGIARRLDYSYSTRWCFYEMGIMRKDNDMTDWQKQRSERTPLEWQVLATPPARW